MDEGFMAKFLHQGVIRGHLKYMFSILPTANQQARTNLMFGWECAFGCYRETKILQAYQFYEINRNDIFRIRLSHNPD